MGARYSPSQQVIHWMTALLMFAVLPVAWITAALKEDTKEFYFWLDIHKVIGLLLLVLTAGRILWRVWDRPPALPATVGTWNRRLAHSVYGSLLIMMIAMPLTGYVWTTGHGYDVAPFDWFTLPRLFYKNRVLGDYAKNFHVWGRWFIYALITLHVSGVAFHLIWKRDGLLERMLPQQHGPATQS